MKYLVVYRGQTRHLDYFTDFVVIEAETPEEAEQKVSKRMFITGILAVGEFIPKKIAICSKGHRIPLSDLTVHPESWNLTDIQRFRCPICKTKTEWSIENK